MELKLQNVSKKFNDKMVLNNVSYTFEKGKIYGLLGKNGAGKTTLFNCISHDLITDSGDIFLDIGHGEQADYDSSHIGYIQATTHLPAFMTGYEFIKYFLDIHRDLIEHKKHPEEYLALVGIEEADRYKLIRDYSHGMKNKVQMLTSIITSPPVMLLDEPLTSFDLVAAHEMKKLLVSLKSDTVIIMATHIMSLARDLCDEIVLLHGANLRTIDMDAFKKPEFEDELMQILSEDTTVSDGDVHE